MHHFVRRTVAQTQKNNKQTEANDSQLFQVSTAGTGRGVASHCLQTNQLTSERMCRRDGREGAWQHSVPRDGEVTVGPDSNPRENVQQNPRFVCFPGSFQKLPLAALPSNDVQLAGDEVIGSQ